MNQPSNLGKNKYLELVKIGMLYRNRSLKLFISPFKILDNAFVNDIILLHNVSHFMILLSGDDPIHEQYKGRGVA